MQHWFGLSGPAWKTPCTRSSRCAGLPALELVDDALPDETTILNFRRLLERHPLSARLTNVINDVLTENGLLAQGWHHGGCRVDPAPSSTRTATKQRYPEMRQTNKGNQWYFGMKVHVGAEVNRGLAHTVSATAAHVPDISELPNLIREDGRAVFGDKGHAGHAPRAYSGEWH
jgi:IS5 family transposase